MNIKTHLIPQPIFDLEEKIFSPIISEDQRNLYLDRLQAIRDYVGLIYTKIETQNKKKR